MKNRYSILIAVAAMFMATGSPAGATTIINDTGADAFWGAFGLYPQGGPNAGQPIPSFSDVKGNPADFDVTSMEVDYNGHTLTARINSPYFQYWHDGGNYLPGDLFISTDGWSPDSGSAASHYNKDYYGNGTSWEYVIHLAGLQTGAVTGGTSLYNTNDGTITFGTDRTVQEVAFAPSAGATSHGQGTWSLVGGFGNASNPYTAMLITTTLPNSFSNYSRLGLHWSMTCGNDIVEGEVSSSAPVPEPATMFLFGVGVTGILGMARKKRAS